MKQHIAFLLQEWQKNRPIKVLGAYDTTLLPETSELTKRITCGIPWLPSQERECDDNPKRRVCRLFCKVEGKHDAQRNLAGRYFGYFLIYVQYLDHFWSEIYIVLGVIQRFGEYEQQAWTECSMVKGRQLWRKCSVFLGYVNFFLVKFKLLISISYKFIYINNWMINKVLVMPKLASK